MSFVNDCPGWSRAPSGSIEYRIYTLWMNMRHRCYSETYHKTHPTYIGCYVCEEWKVLSRFAEEIKSLPGYIFWRDNPNCKVSLDKDTIYPNNKEYSKNTCQFITMSANSLEMNSRCVANGTGGHSIAAINKIAASKSRRVRAINKITGEISEFRSQTEASKVLGVSKASITTVISGKKGSMCNYIFERVEKDG